MRYNPHKTTTARRLPAKLVKQWFGVVSRRQFHRGSVQARRADRTSLLSSCISTNLPSCHRAAFPPLFAQPIPFPYKECEGRGQQNCEERNVEITALLPLVIYMKAVLQRYTSLGHRKDYSAHSVHLQVCAICININLLLFYPYTLRFQQLRSDLSSFSSPE